MAEISEVIGGGLVGTDARFALGDRAKGRENSKEFVYCQANGALTANDVVIIDETYQATPADTTVSATAFGDVVGVADVAFSDNDFGWIQVKGIATINVATGAAANTALNTTGTAGQLDDDATSGAEVVDRLVITAAESGGSAPGVLNYPSIGATL